ncbi:MAG: HAD family hydrolase [Olegusella sp.]|jgi:FMN phosphatase YigB (HAD superfamily)|nr:HAD family hydrolase [Olegusella sp.]
MIKAVLFDLDDTLLDINLTAFLGRYILGLSGILGLIDRTPAPMLQPALLQAYLAIDSQKRKDDLTNYDLFCACFYRRTGIPLSDPLISQAISCFERTVLPSCGKGIVQAAPRRGMPQAVEKVHELGLVCALASNPVFSLDVDRMRMRWADVSERDFEAITTINNSRRCKPSAVYYQDFITKLGFEPRECLMVGNDATRDFPRPDIGMHTLYVGHARPRRAFWRGKPERLAADLPLIIDAVNEQSR